MAVGLIAPFESRAELRVEYTENSIELVKCKGDSALVDRLNLITMGDTVTRGRRTWYVGHSGRYSWASPGGIRLALELVEPRFAGEWRDRLPPAIRDAEKPPLELTGQKFGIVE